MSKKLRAAAVIASGALPVIAAPVATAQAVTHPGPSLRHPAAQPDAACGGSVVTWQDNYDNRYLEVYAQGKANGNWVDAYPGNGGCNQKWFAVSSGYSYYGGTLYGMVNANSAKCLAWRGGGNGSGHVVQWSCGYSYYNYRWIELSAYYANHAFAGWLLVETGPGAVGSQGMAACEGASHWVYGVFAASVLGYVSAYKNCVWH